MIPDAAVEAAAKAMYAQDGGVGEFNLWVYQDYAKAMLEAAAPHMLAEAQSVAWEHCAKKAEAATKLAAPDHITPMGARVIRKSVEANPYRIAK